MPPDPQDPDEFSRDSGGISAAGAFLIDVSDATVKALINRGTNINAGGAVRDKADYQRDMVMVDGGLSIDTSTTKDRGAIAGAFGITVASRKVKALVDDAIVHAGSLDVTATKRDLVVAVSAGGSGALRGEVAVSGSVNVNVFVGETKAKVTSSMIDVAGDATVSGLSNHTARLGRGIGGGGR